MPQEGEHVESQGPSGFALLGTKVQGPDLTSDTGTKLQGAHRISLSRNSGMHPDAWAHKCREQRGKSARI